MKLIHLSDLHIGKRVNDVSMLEDQKYILDQILAIIDKELPEAVLIAGDVYDKSIPSTEAVELLDGFLYQLSQRDQQVFISSGNHDSPERLAFGRRLMSGSGIHLSPVYSGQVTPHRIGDVNIYMLPFLKPSHVRRFFPEARMESCTDAVRTAIAQMHINPKEKNVLLAHQFVIGASVCDSEEISVGGSDGVDASVFQDFDYVALGHLHGPQTIVPNKVRYCGTPLKYSFSESRHKKSVTVVEIDHAVTVRTIPLVPIRDMREIKGTYEELTAKTYWENTSTDDYLHIILTDEEDVPEAIGRLRAIYPNLMKLSYDNARTRSSAVMESVENIQSKSPLTLFSELYELQNNQPMSEIQRKYVLSLIDSIMEETK